jgi:DNA-binding NarL/FixJ family response regulator
MAPDLRSSPIRILIVDDHPVVLAGLTSMLSTQPDFEVVGSASGGEEALQVLGAQSADIVLLDLRMPGMSGIDTLLALKANRIHVRSIVLTSFETDEDIYRSVQAGAQGYLLKGAPQVDVIDAIHTVHAGRRYFPSGIAARLAERLMRSDLTPRELEVLHMLARGLTNKEIGNALRISGNTVRNHVNSIIEKLEVSDRTEAATTAIQRGIIEISN